ncbi:MAG: tetratricopeptide repeat protein, partial [Dehalococcoidia bacterium]|nr:tetratricopeptide repeat protein [Dehalococcoidia bacterium]
DDAEAYDHYLKGRHYYYNITFRDNDLAEREFERALQLDPDYPLALAGLADAYVQRYKERFDYDEYWLDSSDVLIDRALVLDPDLAEAYESRAEVFLQEDNMTGAREAAEKAKDLRPDWDEPYVHLGNIYRQRGERSKALVMFDTALSMRPSVDAWCGRGNIFLTRGHIDYARAAYREAMELNPHHDRPYLDLAWLHEELYEGAEAESLYWRAIEVRPDHATGYELLSQRMFYRGGIQEGEELLRGFVERFPYNWDAYNALYDYLAWWRGDYPAAFKIIEEAVSRNPKRVWPHLLLASSYAEKKSPQVESDKAVPASEQAVIAVDRALALRPNSGRVLEWAGYVYCYLNRLDEAMKYFNRALEVRPGSSDLLTGIAAFLLWREEFEKAALFARAAVEQSPGNAGHYYYLQHALLSLNREQEAFDIIQQAAKEYGDDPTFLHGLSREQRLAGKFEEAINTSQRALAVKRAGWGGFEQLGIALWLSGDAEGALSKFREEIDRYPSAYWIVAILKSEGRFDEIESYLDSIKSPTPGYLSGIDFWAAVAGPYYMSMRRFDEALGVYTE